LSCKDEKRGIGLPQRGGERGDPWGECKVQGSNYRRKRGNKKELRSRPGSHIRHYGDGRGSGSDPPPKRGRSIRKIEEIGEGGTKTPTSKFGGESK